MKILLACLLGIACVGCANKDTRENSQLVYKRTYDDARAEGLNHESAESRALLMQIENDQKPKGAKDKIVDGIFEGIIDGILGIDDEDDFFE